jgi:hypothetical protein
MSKELFSLKEKAYFCTCERDEKETYCLVAAASCVRADAPHFVAPYP